MYAYINNNMQLIYFIIHSIKFIQIHVYEYGIWYVEIGQVNN